jgi:hypothetical protein
VNTASCFWITPIPTTGTAKATRRQRFNVEQESVVIAVALSTEADNRFQRRAVAFRIPADPSMILSLVTRINRQILGPMRTQRIPTAQPIQALGFAHDFLFG